MGEALIGAAGAILGAILTVTGTIASSRLQNAFHLTAAREAGERDVALAWRTERYDAYTNFIAVIGRLEEKLHRIADRIERGEAAGLSPENSLLARDLPDLFDALSQAVFVGGDAIQIPSDNAMRGLFRMENEVSNRLAESQGQDLAQLKLERAKDLSSLSKLNEFRWAARADLGVPASSLAAPGGVPRDSGSK